MRTRSSLALISSFLVLCAAVRLQADEDPQAVSQPASDETDGNDADKAAETPAQPTPEPTPASRKSTRRLEKSDAFIAPADWEFDGFVAGGQDQEVRSLYYLNDLVYVNVGTEQGFNVGDRVSIFKRGQRVRDPQTGKFMGFEVRRAATSQVTNHITGRNCSLRILQANEAVEVGDLVRRAD